MRKTAAAIPLITALLIAAEVTMFLSIAIGLVGAQPNYVTIPDIEISSPPQNPPYKYENSTVMLVIYVRMFNDSPTLKSIFYSLDEKPPVFIKNLTISSVNNFGLDKIDFTVYTARVNLQGLSEGNHTVIANASGMSTSRAFSVNSHYQVPVVKVLSPTNQTYSNMVPLIFTVNGEIKEAHYYLYRGYDAVFENSFSGNTTLDNLSDGSYVMHLYVTTEKGEATTSTYFSISNNDYLVNSLVVVGITALMVFAIAFGALIYFKKRRRQSQLLQKQSDR
jgi:hypothetical protein